ncbi:MAG: hypothetical protein QM730_07395 [Anaerolineales bacterium]
MESSVHSYRPLARSVQFWLFNLVGCYFILGSFYVGFSSWFINMFGNLLGFLFYFVFGLFALFFGNMFPEIISDKEGLLVQFLFWRLRIKWQDIVELKKNSLLSSLGTSRYVIKTKSLTPLHCFYGLYALSFAPSFMIKSDISDFSLLLKRIQERKFDLK